MKPALTAGILLALFAAALHNAGMVVEKAALKKMPELHTHHSLQMIRTLFAAPLWIAGLALIAGGLASRVEALTLAPIYVVQSASACGIVLLIVLSHSVLGERHGGRELAGIALVVSALLLLGISVHAHATRSSREGSGAALFATVLPALGASLASFLAAERIASPGRRGAGFRAPLYGVSAGLLYGVAGLGVKDVSTIVAHRGVRGALPHLLAAPALYLVVFLTALGLLVLQAALQRCHASVLVPVNNVVGGAFTIALGGVIFHEPLPTSGVSGICIAGAFVFIVAGFFTLALGRLKDAPGPPGSPADRHHPPGAHGPPADGAALHRHHRATEVAPAGLPFRRAWSARSPADRPPGERSA